MAASELRVCLVGELTGGVGVYGQNLLRGLGDLGVDCTVVTPTPELATACHAVGVRRVHGRGRWLLQSRAFAKGVAEVAAQCDLVHFTDARFNVLARRLPVPAVGTMNDYFYAITGWASSRGTKDLYHDWPARHAYYNLLRTAEERTLPRYDAVLCISTAVQDVLATRYGLDRTRLPIVHYGIEYGPADAPPLPTAHPLVLFAGGNFQRKGLGVLLRAAPRILAVDPEIRIVVIGDSKDAGAMRRLSVSLGVSGNVDFVGQVDYSTLYRYYTAADVFAMPSLLEAFGIPYLEAMHCAVPVVASDVAGPSDYLRGGRNALLPPAGDVDALADAVVAALYDEVLRARLIAGGLATSSEFTVERMAAQTLDVYREVLQR